MAAGAPKNKAALLLAMGPLKAKPGASGGGGEMESEGEEESPPASGDIKSMATEDVMAAIKSGDKAGLADALTRFVSCCGGEHEEE